MKSWLCTLALLSQLLLFPGCVLAESSPYVEFNTATMMAEEVRIIWRVADDVQKECNRESHRRGWSGFRTPLQACAFWEKTAKGQVCTIVTKRTLNYWTLGHETRHCFQGEWHAWK